MPIFPTPTQIFTQYQNTLKGLRPDINEQDPSGEALIRGRVTTGIISAMYGDQRKVDDDTYIRDARPSALLRHGADYDIPKQPATFASTADAVFTGTAGTNIAAGTQVRYVPTGIIYTTQALAIIGVGGSVSVALQAATAGQIGNVAVGQTLQLVTPLVGVNNTITLGAALADGADTETDDSYRARLLNRRQRPPSGGNQFDYPQFAFEASDTVRSAFIRRFARGLGSVDVYITSGTTDIDTAVTNGLPVLRIPTPATITTVQAYYEAQAPLTDCPRILAPVEVAQDVTVRVRLAAGITLATVPSDTVYNPLALNVEQLIAREVARVLYKVPVGGRTIPGLPNGYVVAADIETQLDIMLSAVPDDAGIAQGNIPVLLDRQVSNLDGVNVNRELIGNQLAAPGVTTVVVGV